MKALLAELDERLRARKVAASVYVVGGAAMALAYGRDTVTPDIDAIASHRAAAGVGPAPTRVPRSRDSRRPA